ncbi:MAG: 3-deoxy-manno-octulosonate cytidylyltransferase [Nitrospiraceae bacterium]
MVTTHASRAPQVTVVIPARYGSTRFPGKPLAQLAGKPMLQHVYEAARRARLVDHVIVATDDPRIQAAAVGFGAEVVMTDAALRTGTDRVAAVAAIRPGDHFVDVQGDEVMLSPDLLTDLIEPYLASGVPMGTLKRALDNEAELLNPGVVKVATDSRGDALYFSRAPIPYVRDHGGRGMLTAGLHFIHLGVYIYSRATLARLAALPTGRLEEVEKLEQLRALEDGITIRVWETRHRSLRVDTPEDLHEAEAVLKRVQGKV